MGNPMRFWKQGWQTFAAQPAWFQAAALAGLLLRLYFVIFTPGTYDVNIWQDHARNVRELGVIEYYHKTPMANHPPFMCQASSLMLSSAEVSGIPFRVILRLPFALLDCLTAILLFTVFRQGSRGRWLAVAYWLHPLAIMLSSYHGNTDSSMAFFVLLALWLLTRGKIVCAGVVLGASLWIKLPAILAFPALLLSVDGWRNRLWFAAVAGATAISTYLPALWLDAAAVLKNVVGYHGQLLQTTDGVPVWGWFRVLMPNVVAPEWMDQPPEWVRLLVNQSWRIALGLLLVLVWRRHQQRTPLQVGATLAASYTLVFGLTENWAFQYFAWAIPFWFFLPGWYAILASILAGGYIYSLYWFLCGSPGLRGEWDFLGHPQWPDIVTLFRDYAVLFFFVTAVWFLISVIAPGRALRIIWPPDENPDPPEVDKTTIS